MQQMKLPEFLQLLKEAKENWQLEKLKFKLEKENLYIRQGGKPYTGNNPALLAMQGAEAGLYLPFSKTYTWDNETKKRTRLYNITEAKRYFVAIPKMGSKKLESSTGLATVKEKDVCYGVKYWQVVNVLDLLPVDTYTSKISTQNMQHEDYETAYIRDMLELQHATA